MIKLSASNLDLKEFIRAGDTIVCSQASAEPQSLLELLVAQRANLGGITLQLGLGFTEILLPEHSDHIRFVGTAATTSYRRLIKAGVFDLLPAHLSKMDSYISSGLVPCDVAFIQISPPDARGQYSLGVAADYIRAAIRRARVVIAEVNAAVPWVPCAEPLTADELHVVIETDRPLAEMPSASVGEIERRIAGFCQDFIPDRATLQVGIGSVPDAIMHDLTNRRDLAIHSGMIGDSAVNLIECGAVTNAYKDIDQGITITGMLIGTRRLFSFCHKNAAVRLHPVSYTHGQAVLANLSRFISINSAIEVDLYGQVNAETANGQYIGTIGGQVDYVRAASSSKGGHSIIAVPSTAKSGSISRIVPRLTAPVTTARSDVDVIVTEFGSADLRGKTLKQRAAALIAIASPEHREALARSSHDAKVVF